MSETERQWEGQIIAGKFELRTYLGGSEDAAVFEAEREGQQVAIKLIRANETEASDHLSRWTQIATLSHPHLVRLFETGRCRIGDADFVYAVMERADESLAEILPQRSLTPTEVGELLPPVLNALTYLHGQGFSHACMKPSNILALGEQVKLSSDGIRPIGTREGRSKPYDAPEVSRTGCSAASDIWSLGLTLAQALTQQIPRWQGAHPAFLGELPQPFLDIARNCLQHAPQSRWSLGDILARLQPSHPPLVALSEATSQIAPAMTSTDWRKSLLPGAALIALAGIVVFVAMQLEDRSQSRQDAMGVREPTATEKVKRSTSLSPHEAVPSSAAPTDAAPDSQAPSAASEVTERVIPEVPSKARDTIRGTVKVAIRVDVDPAGQVTSVSIDSPGPSRYFANLAAGAARRWAFAPARADDGAKPRIWILRFEFTQAATRVFPTRFRP